MIPRSSSIGYLVYEDLILPVTGVALQDGQVIFKSHVVSDIGGEIAVDDNAECTLIGADGSQIFWVGRTGPPAILTAYDGGKLIVEQRLYVIATERTTP